MNRRRGRALAEFAVLVFATGACRSAPEAREGPVPVEVRCVPIARTNVETTETVRGRLEAPPGGDLPVASQVAGRVVEVDAHEGDHVSAGAVVALIDGSTSRDALRQADAVVGQSRAALANADATLDRTRQLVARGIAAKQELDDAVARDDQAKGALNAAIAAADLARRTLGRVVVRSTFEGVVTRVWRGPGALVDGTAATPVVELAAAAAAEFDVDATERQLARVAVGQIARVTLEEFDQGEGPLEGTVRARSAALDPATGLGLVRIALSVAEDRGPLTLGVFGTASVRTGTRPGMLVVPSVAIRGAVSDGAEVAVCADGRAEIRTVKIGWRDDERAEVTEGLREGERIAVDHVLGLETGTPIAEARH